MDWKIVLFWLLVSLQLYVADCIDCYSCFNVTQVEQCKSVIQCPSGYICHATHTSNTYTLGCKDSKLCPVVNTTTINPGGGVLSIVGRRFFSSGCSECCGTGMCNRQLCQNTDPTCHDSGHINCVTTGAYVNLCSETERAKKECRRFCGLCSIDGSWTNWGQWSSCSKTCDTGTHRRSRSCTNPSPSLNGRSCVGNNTQVDTCSVKQCVVTTDGAWTNWGQWSACSRTCDMGAHKRSRSCTNPAPSLHGRSCVGDDIQVDICSMKACVAPTDGGWSNWGQWSACSRTCDTGTHRRSRSCTNPSPSLNGRSCVGDSTQVDTCSIKLCVVPIDGGWTNWGQWSACSRTCDMGTHKRLRSCTNPTPSLNGRSCVGDKLQVYSCSVKQCVVTTDGGWTAWSYWSACTQTCGVCTQNRYRSCTNPPPSGLGRSCVGHSSDVNTHSLKSCVDQNIKFAVWCPRETGTSGHITFTKTLSNHGGGYNANTGEFTCSVAGEYWFKLFMSSSQSDQHPNCHIYKNAEYLGEPQYGILPIADTNVTVHLLPGDKVYLKRCSPTSFMMCATNFSGRLFHAD